MRSGFLERTLWLIKLRWIAIFGIFAFPAFITYFFSLKVNLRPIVISAVIILAYNVLIYYYVMYISGRSENIRSRLTLIDNIQISLDLVVLTVILHNAGGIENPFIFFFIFHIIISGIMLPRAQAIMQATLAVLLVNSMILAEFSGLIKHWPVGGYLKLPLYNNGLYAASNSFIFITTVYISLYMASSISQSLKDREQRLVSTNKMLEEKDKIKSEYVLRVTHDIKGHIAAIQSCIHPVRAGITGPLNDKQSNLLGRADDRTEKLMTFTKSLLNLTIMKLNSNVDKKHFNAAEAAAKAVNFVRPNAAAKKIDLKTAFPAQGADIDASESEIQAVLIELLSNAIRYTPESGRVSLDMSLKNNITIIEISDSGIGIPENEVQKVFTEFYRATNAMKIENNSGGSGLGLSIVKQAIERAGGNISIVSIEGKGTKIKIEIPAVFMPFSSGKA